MAFILTVSPLERVVDWVVEGRATGDAKPRLTGWMDFKAERLRNAWLRLKANRRDAIAAEIQIVEVTGKGKRGRGRG